MQPMPTNKYQAANDNHQQLYEAFNARLGQFMRGERTIPASMSDEEWAQYQRASEGRRLCKTAALAGQRVHGLGFFSNLRGTKKPARHAA